MRRVVARLAALAAGALGIAGAAGAQARTPARTPAPAAAPVAAPVVAPAPTTAEVRRQVDLVRRDPNAIPLPPADSFTVGPRVVPAGAAVPGTVAVARGDLEVRGTVEGNAIAVGGDVVVLPGGHVKGNAFSALGRVRLAGGAVDGEIRALGGAVGPLAVGPVRTASPAVATLRSLKLAFGWLAVLTVIGIGVLMFAGTHLDGVADALERGFLRAFWLGLGGQLLALPALLVLVVALAVTVIGALLIPFAIVAYCIALAGLITLGFLATAHVTGRSIVHRRARAHSERGGALRALVLGVVLFLALWVLAAALAWAPAAAVAVRFVALVVTWVAATVGFGAAIASRAGTRTEAPIPAAAAQPVRAPEDPLPWATPTPVGGVVAARRPTPAPTGYGDR